MDIATSRNFEADAKSILSLMMDNLQIQTRQGSEFVKSVSEEVRIGEVSFEDVEDAIDRTIERDPKVPWKYFEACMQSVRRDYTKAKKEIKKEAETARRPTNAADDYESIRNRLFREPSARITIFSENRHSRCCGI